MQRGPLRTQSNFCMGFAPEGRGRYTPSMTQNLVTKSKFAALAGVNPSTVTRLCSTLLAGAVVGKHIDAAHPCAVEYLAAKERDHAPGAATGLDPLYEEAIEKCRTDNRYSRTFLQKALGVGYNRASRIFKVMELNGVIPEPDQPAAEPTPQVTIKPKGQAAAREKRKQETPPSADHVYEVPEHIEDFADMTIRELTYRFGTDVRFLDWLKATKSIEDIHEKRLKNAQTKGTLISRGLVQIGVIDVFNSAHLKLMKDGAKSIAAGTVSKHAAGADLVEIETYISDILGSFIRPVKNKIKRALDNANP